MEIRKVNEIEMEETPHKVDVRKLYDNSSNVARILVVKTPKPRTQSKLL
jgi:hypothetical protein